MGDDVVIPESLTATIVDDQTINNIQLMNGFLNVEQTGSLRFLNLDVLVQGVFTASLNNYGSITGDLRENQATVKNFAGAAWIGDVLDNPSTIENRESATWEGDVHNSGSLSILMI